jgi:hypothetical protein
MWGQWPHLLWQWMSPTALDPCGDTMEPMASKLLGHWNCLAVVCGLLTGSTENSTSRSKGPHYFHSFLHPTGWFTTGRVLKHWDQQAESPVPLSLHLQYRTQCSVCWPLLWCTQEHPLAWMFAVPRCTDGGCLCSQWEPGWPTGHKAYWGQQQLLATEKKESF